MLLFSEIKRLLLEVSLFDCKCMACFDVGLECLSLASARVLTCTRAPWNCTLLLEHRFCFLPRTQPWLHCMVMLHVGRLLLVVLATCCMVMLHVGRLLLAWSCSMFDSSCWLSWPGPAWSWSMLDTSCWLSWAGPAWSWSMLPTSCWLSCGGGAPGGVSASDGGSGTLW